jgi:putative transposase
VTTVARRAVVAEWRAAAGLSERRACRFLGVGRSSQRYRARRTQPAGLRERLTELAAARPRWGYRRLWVLLRREGYAVNWKRVYRLYRQAGLAVRRRRRKRAAVARRPLPPATRPNERWSMDFVHDRLTNGRWFRSLTIVDDFTRECLAIEVDRSLTGARVVEVLTQLAQGRPLARTIVVDNGPEFAGRVLDAWAYRRGITLAFIQPGKPTQNAFIESFNSRLRDECLNAHWFVTVTEAQHTIEHWRDDYNTQHPHGSLGRRTPSEFAAQWKEVTSLLTS